MTDITPTSTTSTTSTAASLTGAAQAASEGADRVISSDFETFLNMLTAQLENQDPLNPLQSTDFAVQLATFSGVEQQVLTNDRLAELTGQLTASSVSSLSGWIGNEVLTSEDIAFDGEPVDLITQTEPDAARAELVIRTQEDVVLDRFDISPDGGPVGWNGQTAAGAAQPWGTYRFTTISYDASGNVLGETVAESYQQVIEVRLQDGNPELALKGGGTISATEISALREP